MKLLIITSSIFYLLGLKLTNQVEIDKQSVKDSVQIEIKTNGEVILPETETPKLPEVNLKKDEKPTSTCGSAEKTAPWYSQQEVQKIN